MPRLRHSVPLASLLAVGGMLVTGTVHGDDWPTFRGTARTAVAPDTNLLESWPEGGPKLLWKAVGRWPRLRHPGDRRQADLYPRRRPLHRR